MILQSLVKLYEILEEQKKVTGLGWSLAKISFRIMLNKDGELVGLVSACNPVVKGKKEIYLPTVMMVPEQAKRSSGIKPQFLCDTSSYFLGIDDKGNTEREKQKAKKRAIECFRSAGRLHHQILDSCDSYIAKSILKFFDTWSPENAKEIPCIKENLEDIYSASNFIFQVNGEDAQQNSEIKNIWEVFSFSGDSTEQKIANCLVTGKENQPIAILHPSIKGVPGAQSSGASIVSFNERSFESYGNDKAQGLNAPVSEYAAFAYGTALNYLLNDRQHTHTIGGTTLVYWSEKAKSAYQDIFDTFLIGGFAGISDQDLERIITNIQRGIPADLENVVIDPQEPFYILGLSPNAARLSVRFFLRNSFGEILKCIDKHQEQMSICKADWEKEIIPLKWILKETANSHSTDSAASPLLAGALFRSIFTDGLYPAAVFQNIMLRIFADRDEVTSKGTTIKKINYVKAAFIKAYLLRNHKQRWEEKLTMSVNENCNEIPYVLGRLFSVLESVQSKANPGIKATIKDRYFNSACATPSSIYPILIKLSNAHLGKIEGGLQIYYSKKIQELLSKIAMPNHGTPLPNRLALEEQGAFILGYYQETQARFTSKEEQ